MNSEFRGGAGLLGAGDIGEQQMREKIRTENSDTWDEDAVMKLTSHVKET